MTHFARHAVALTLCLNCIVSTLRADESIAVKDAIRQHSEAVAKIRSYHLKIETHSSHFQGLPDSSTLRFGPFLIGSGEAEGRLVHESTTEIWQQGSRRHWIDRSFFSVGEKGVLDFGERGSVYEYSIDSSSLRFLSGWDWENPPAQVPLDISRSFNEVASVNCSISTVDPIAINDKLSMDRAAMCWDLFPGWSLAKIAEACELVEVAQADSSVTRLQILSISSPDIFANASMYIGSVIDLDHKHGWLISRFEMGEGETLAVRQATQFRQTESGYWYASEWDSVRLGRRTDVTSIPICEINREFTEDELEVRFPEGARVDDIGGRIHLWGDRGPKETFSSSEDYLNYQKNHITDLQRGGPPQHPLVKGQSNRDWIFVVNAVLLALIALFAYLRRRVSRRA